MDKIIQIKKHIVQETKNQFESFLFNSWEENRLPTTDFKMIDVSSKHDTIKNIGEENLYIFKEELSKNSNTAMYIEEKTIQKYFNITFDNVHKLYEDGIISHGTAESYSDLLNVAITLYKCDDHNKDFLLDDLFENLSDRFIQILNILDIKSIISLIPLSSVDD